MSLFDQISPPVFYYEGKPFEMNAAGIYVPHVPCCAVSFSIKPQHFEWTAEMVTSANEGMKKLTSADILDAAEKMKDSALKHVTTSLFDDAGLWKPLSDSSIGKNHQKMLDTGKLFSSLAAPIAPPDYLDAIDAYKSKMLSSYGVPPGLLSGGPLHITYASLLADIQSRRRRFIIEHDDSHLFTRGTVKGAAEERDEQRILRGIHGGGEYVWSESLQSHVRLA